MSKRPTQDEIQDLLNAQQAQQQNSVYDSAYSEYCGGCGNKTCTCLYKARKKAIENGGGTASGLLNGIGFILFLLFTAIICKYLNII